MSTTKKPSASKPLKDPRGGLTAAGRKHFAKIEGANLRPGVTKAEKDMSAEEMRRKGSFLRRHYGRKNPFKLVDKKGEPTRYALQAQAWGERLPKSPEDVQRLAEKGSKLLQKGERAEARSDGARSKPATKAKTSTKTKSATKSTKPASASGTASQRRKKA